MNIVTGFFQVMSSHVLRLRNGYVFLVCLLIVIAPFLVAFGTAPPSFKTESVLVIPVGSSVTQSALLLASNQYIYTSILLRVALVLEGSQSIKSGAYYFPQRENVWSIAYRLHRGITQNADMSVTFPEGTPRFEMARILSQKIPGFDMGAFMTSTVGEEGYLFPDTYHIQSDEPVETIVSTMRQNYDAHKNWYDAYASKHISEKDAVILASLLEGEANNSTDQKIVAGILLKRLSHHMRLQVDAPFGYERQKRGYVPTKNDIETNTSYNTYRNEGLPPTPINNPGYYALYAAIHPTQSPFLYYLTGSDGNMHYAKTFAEHIANQKKYFK